MEMDFILWRYYKWDIITIVVANPMQKTDKSINISSIMKYYYAKNNIVSTVKVDIIIQKLHFNEAYPMQVRLVFSSYVSLW